jgi:hypothetical protein
MDRDELLKLINDDEEGLLTVKPRPSAAQTADERLIKSFQEINEFMREIGREPQVNKNDMSEMTLHNRLKGMREDAAKIEALRGFDEFKLLGEPKKIETMQDIFDDDDLGLLNDGAEAIFELKHVPSKAAAIPDYIARRKPCPDFVNFEHLFKQCHSDLANGERKLMPFSQGSQISPGDFFVLKGLLVYVAEEGKKHPTFDGTFNARLRCIFDNGTESDLLLRSLAAALYKDGRRVSGRTDQLAKAINNVTDEDLQTGYIYVLKSLSERPEIKSLKHLYKIGFSRVPVEQRTKNAVKEPTYLMAPIAILTTYQCYNLNPQKFENLLHTFFGKACLSIDVFDAGGRRHVPREWFIAPLDVISTAVELLISGEIVNYKYDLERQEIVGRLKAEEAL